jgi:hypothetical protein
MASKLNFSLEEAIVRRNIMIRFINYLVAHYAEENLRFWLEAQIFKYEKDQQKCKEAAEKLYARYWGPSARGLNVEEEHLVMELSQKIKRPDRTIFMLVQNAIWGLLKLECYPRFKNEEGLNEKKIKESKLKIMMKNEQCKELIELLDQFIRLNEEFPCVDNGVFKATVLPNDQYAEHLHTTLPNIDEVWRDPDLMLAFREYLYQQYAHENLSFYLEATNYEYLTDQTEIEIRAKEISEKFVGPTATLPINLEYVVTQRLQKALLKPTNLTYKPVTDKIYKVLTNEWFPDFIVSPLYHACNDETIEFTRSGGRTRSRTLNEYDLFCKNIGITSGNKKIDAKNL